MDILDSYVKSSVVETIEFELSDTFLTTVSCNAVTDVDLTLLTSGDIYTDTNVQFSADILPNDAGKPYNYTIDYDDGTAPVTGASNDDPLTFNHIFATSGSHIAEIAVWNCAMTAMEAVRDEVSVASAPAPSEFWTYLPIVTKNY